MIVPIILAGGSGTRLWPLSRDLYPKQLLPLLGERTMLQETVARVRDFPGAGNPIVICNENHRFFVAEQMRRMNIPPEAIILEPVGRNTAPAVAVGALKALESHENPLLLVLPADHHIEDRAAFHLALETGARMARKGSFVTFGIVPSGPETGYGYIRKGPPADPGVPGAFELDRFVEKPDEATARTYVESGEYLWNSGMFLFPARAVLDELSAHAPGIVEACREALANGVEDLDFFRLDGPAFTASPAISIDHAVMEKTGLGVVVPVDLGWSDLGSWEALWQAGDKDENGNVIQGDVLTRDSRGCYLNAGSRLLAAVGISGHVVVETSDAVLVAPRDRTQEVRHIVERLRKKAREEAESHKKVLRPWGSYESMMKNERFQVKRIIVKPGSRLSLQKHFHRAEHWIVVRGTGIITRGEERFTLHEDQSTYIPLGTVHRLENPGRVPLEIIEVQTGEYLGEDDIERLNDDYGR